MVNEIKKVVNKYRQDLFNFNNVIGVGCGYKLVNGRQTDEESIVVLVKDKKDKVELNKDQMIPQTIEQKTTDVIEVGEVELLTPKKDQVRTIKLRPAQPGVSIGHHKITAGTFGAIVKDQKTGQPLILSNNHVLANITNGEDGRAQPGDKILQPGTYDGGEDEDVIGYLKRFVPIYERESSSCPLLTGFKRLLNGVGKLFDQSYELRPTLKENEVDCAVAEPKNKDLIKPEIIEIGKPKGVTKPEVGMKVKKSGRTTGLSNSQIKAIDVSIKVQLSDSAEAIFTDQIVTEPFSQPGDSGALVVNKQREAVGLLFAGSEKSTICNNIQNVLQALNVTF